MAMGFFDKLFGRDQREQPRPRSDDEQALDRYRYLLRTAPPEAIEQVHTEAFAQLTPEQRQRVLAELAAHVPEYERRGANDDPRNLARLATRAEMRQPGTLERTFSRMPQTSGGGPGFGSMFASSLLGSIAGYVIGSAIADQLFADDAVFADNNVVDTGGFDNQGGLDDGSGFDDGGGSGVGDVERQRKRVASAEPEHGAEPATTLAQPRGSFALGYVH
jgi:hypothetical protein